MKVEYTQCDECNKKKESDGGCGDGWVTLFDSVCSDCGGKQYHFCSWVCLKKWVNGMKLEEAKK